MFRRLSVVCLLVLSGASTLRADDSRLSVGLAGGFAVQTKLDGDYEPSDVRMGVGELNFAGTLVGKPGAPRLQAIAAVMVGQSTHPGSRFTVGPVITFRVHFAPERKVGTYLEAGAGVVSTAMRVPAELTGPFQYALQVGTGLRIRTGKRSDLTVGWRGLHFSNHGLILPNQGLNLHTAVVGWSIRLN